MTTYKIKGMSTRDDVLNYIDFTFTSREDASAVAMLWQVPYVVVYP